jgi:hypothetical protein
MIKIIKMSRINNTSKKLKKVEYLFEDITEKCLKLIRYVGDTKYTESSKIVQRLAETCEIDDEQALSIVLNTCKLLAQDSIDFLDQKDNFDILTIETDFENCQFIAEIWNGDAYDTTECEALDEFRKDIENQFSTLKDTEKLIIKCQTEYISLVKRGEI